MTTEPTKPDDSRLPDWARGALAIIREVVATLAALLRHPLHGAPGLGTVTVGTILFGVSVLWFVWAVVLDGGATFRDAIPGVIGALSAWQGMRARRPYAADPYGGGYAAPYGGAFDGYDGGIPGDTEWPVN